MHREYYICLCLGAYVSRAFFLQRLFFHTFPCRNGISGLYSAWITTKKLAIPARGENDKTQGTIVGFSLMDTFCKPGLRTRRYRCTSTWSWRRKRHLDHKRLLLLSRGWGSR